MEVKKFNNYINESSSYDPLETIGNTIFKDIYDNEISKKFDTISWSIDYEYVIGPGNEDLLGFTINVFFEYNEIFLNYLDDLEKFNKLKKISNIIIGYNDNDPEQTQLVLSCFFDFNDDDSVIKLLETYPSILSHLLKTKLKISNNIKNNKNLNHIFGMNDIGLF